MGKECEDFEDRWKSIDVVGAYFTSSLSISYGEAFTSTFEPHFTLLEIRPCLFSYLKC